MRAVVLLVVAGCWRQEQAATAPRPAPEPHAPVAAPSEPPSKLISPPAPTNVAPIGTAQSIPCSRTPNATASGISLSAIDRTGRNIDLCPRMDAALSKAHNIASYQNQGYDVVGELSRIDIHGGDVFCSLRIEIAAPAVRRGLVVAGGRRQGAPAAVAITIDDCVTAVLEDTFVRKIFP